jgi:P27 family predicted phage terminase small subunit
MTKEERSVWDEYISLTPPGLLTSMDAPMFARWVAEYILYQRAHGIVSKSDDLSTVAESGYESPIAALAIMRKSSEVMLKIENEMGFTPAARTKIAINDPPEESEFERFVNKMKTAK